MSSPIGELLERIELLKGNRKVAGVRGMPEVLDIIERLVLMQSLPEESAAIQFSDIEAIKEYGAAVANEAVSAALASCEPEVHKPQVGPPIMEPYLDDMVSIPESSVCSIDLRGMVDNAGGLWDLTKNFPPDIKKLRCKKCVKKVEVSTIVDPMCDKCFKARAKELKKRRKYEEKIRKKQEKKMDKLRKLASTEEEAQVLEPAIAGQVEIVGTADAETLREKIGSAEPDQFHINVYV